MHLLARTRVSTDANRCLTLTPPFPHPLPHPKTKDEIDAAPQFLSKHEVRQARRSSFGEGALDLGTGVEHGMAALKPFEISLTGELEEVGSQRQLLTDDDFFQVDCGGSSGGERPEGWFW